MPTQSQYLDMIDRHSKQWNFAAKQDAYVADQKAKQENLDLVRAIFSSSYQDFNAGVTGLKEVAAAWIAKTLFLTNKEVM